MNIHGDGPASKNPRIALPPIIRARLVFEDLGGVVPFGGIVSASSSIDGIIISDISSGGLE